MHRDITRQTIMDTAITTTTPETNIITTTDAFIIPDPTTAATITVLITDITAGINETE